jgi:endonuclease YncB( thermonuclease family)
MKSPEILFANVLWALDFPLSISLARGAAFIVMAAAILAALPAAADPITGKVVSVTDGDTVRVLDAANVQHKVRLDGIDAPERGQPFGTVARDRLAALVMGKAVKVHDMAATSGAARWAASRSRART